MTPMLPTESTAAVRRRYGWIGRYCGWANLEGLLYSDARAPTSDSIGERFTWGWVTAAAGAKLSFSHLARDPG